MNNYLVSYSTSNYYERHNNLNASAKHFGINNILSFYDYDLKETSFYRANRSILDNPIGAGFWLWKPYFIKEALNNLKEGDCLLYVDAGSLFINSPEELYNICKHNESGILAFDCWPLCNSQWTKRDTFINLASDSEKFWNSKHVIATVIAFKKCKMTEEFVDEWLYNCQDINSISNFPNINGKENLLNFIDHRMDQSIISILIEKYQIETYRNPSKWGNFLKMKEFRVKGEQVCYPYAINNSITTYSNSPYLNSPYGTIFEFNIKLNEHQDKAIGSANSATYVVNSIIRSIKKISKK